MSSSNSDASQQQTQEQQDNRISAATGSVNLVASRSNIGDVTIQQTDFGAVSKAFDFAGAMADGAANELAASGARQVAVTKSALAAVQDAYANTTEKIAGAYTEAKAGEQKILVGVGLVIVGIVAVRTLGRGA